jgi:hypothetical protein
LGITAITCAIFASYWLWRVERQKVIDLERKLHDLTFSHAVFEVRLEQGEPYLRRHENRVYWRFGLGNRGPAVAENVHVCLAAIRPQPSNAIGLLDFPLSLNSSYARINPNADVLFEVFNAYPDPQGGQPHDGGRTDLGEASITYRRFILKMMVNGKWITRLARPMRTNSHLRCSYRPTQTA